MSETATNDVSDRDVRDLAAVLRLLADSARVRILMLLEAHGEMSVGRLSTELAKRQPLVSHHLGLLRSGSLVNVRRDGRNIYYSLAETVDGGRGAGRGDALSVCVTGTAGRCVHVSRVESEPRARAVGASGPPGPVAPLAPGAAHCPGTEHPASSCPA